MGTQKNRLNETGFLSTLNICYKEWVIKYSQVYAENFCLSKRVGGNCGGLQYTWNFINNVNGPRREKTCLGGFANNTGADQFAHPRSLISAFVIRFFGKYHM